MIQTIIYILILLFSYLPGFDNGTIIFFGDSLTAGYGLSKEQAFPAIVEDKLNEMGYDYNVVNAGVSGETSAGGLSRIDWVLNQKFDIFVLELGANDGLRGLPLDQTKKNLQAIIDRVEEVNTDAKIILAGMMVPPNMGEDYSRQFRTMYQELAEENDILLIPFLLDGVGGNPELNLPDRIHPNVKGHKIVADNVLKVLKKAL